MSYMLISEVTARAKKRYRCIWCGELIFAGTRYVREFAKFEGDIQRNQWHPECRDASAEYFNSGEDEFSPFDMERPPSPASLEWDSWDCTLLLQRDWVSGVEAQEVRG